MRVVAAYNIKGGVGKTSAAVNLAFLGARDGYRTLIWDLDPQGGATFLFRVRPRVKGGVRTLVRRRSRLAAQVKSTDFDNLDLLPADFSYRNLDLALDQARRPTRRLAELVAPLSDHYDLLIMDCPPSASLVSEGVLRAADTLLVPLVPATLSLRTLDQLTHFVGQVKPPRPRVLPFLSMVDRRRRLHRDLAAQLRGQLPHLARAEVPASSAVEQMGPRRAPVVTFAPRAPAAVAYRDLWQQVLELGER